MHVYVNLYTNVTVYFMYSSVSYNKYFMTELICLSFRLSLLYQKLVNEWASKVDIATTFVMLYALQYARKYFIRA